MRHLPYSIINAATRVFITRRLPREGTVLVQEGEYVEPTRVVARTALPADFRVVNVAQTLGVPPRKVKRYLKVKVGQSVTEGEVLAGRGFLSRSVVRAPIDGVITGYGRGRLLLEKQPQRRQLTALVPGVVAQVLPDRGVVIEAVGAFVQAAWGNGKEGYGTLKPLTKNARRPLRAKRIDAAVQGAVIVGGATLDEEALERAIEMQVQGIIVGGVPSSLIPRLMEVDFPVIATEGVGKIPMSRPAFRLLRSLRGREASVCGRLTTRWDAERPYVFVAMPLDDAQFIDPEMPLSLGDTVRALRPPFQGMTGEITAFPLYDEMLETGARLSVVEVQMDENTVSVPYLNLERIL